MTDAYAAAGVVYDALDYVKRMGQQGAARTKVSDRLRRLGIGFVEESRGESAVLFEFPEFFLAHVQEGLGTKNRVADHYAIASATTGKTGRTYYDSLARCNSAMVMNDIITCGAEPLSLGIEWAAGSSDWFTQDRVNDLVRGTEHSANETGCVWGPGETPVLKEVINPATLSMSGSGVGIIQPKSRRITGSKLRDGDVMIGFSSSGVHANGLTLARQIGDELEHGYLTEMPSGQTYGDALLTPTQNYARLMQALLAAGIDIHYPHACSIALNTASSG